ncbi:hypothetical protein [Variovorax sp. PCZ-1]|uniref:hypothetical protein n=1 Tax=Variovorax sp. PCZ-1 TaxID=2835533 RepID=UPI001BCD2874|nr:hypothetical protein [Variovorax sp. PCZ-1]MBS7806812.1 hypothetical protein [Variovorax sp. PCZ-1]
MLAKSTSALAVFIGTALLSQAAIAQSCKDQDFQEQFLTWLKHSRIKLQVPAKNFVEMSHLTTSREINANTSYIRCKEWPAKAGHRLILATIPMSEKEAMENKETFELDAVIFVMNANSQIASSSPILKKYLYSDGAFLTDVIFDTARYQLDKNTIAFGIRLGHQVGRWDTFGSISLDLFFERGSSLLHALKSIPVYKSSHNKGINCGAVTEEFNRSLSMADSKSEGLTNIRVVQKSKTTSESVSPKEPNICIEKVTPEAYRSTTLRFNGSHYEIPSDWTQ